MSEPARSRAVLSTEDFELLREAVVHYLEVVKDKPESIKFTRPAGIFLGVHTPRTKRNGRLVSQPPALFSTCVAAY
jgi:hypothetical protein